MPSCEKCWEDACGNYDIYKEFNLKQNIKWKHRKILQS